MRAPNHKRTHVSALLIAAGITFLGSALLASQPPLARAAAPSAPPPSAHVVTAPWAAQGGRPPPADPKLASWQPPALTFPAQPAALPPDQLAILNATKGEQIPEPKWARFVLSNEWRHDVMYARLQGLGGAFIGVATDQNYTMAAAAGSELLFLMDYDNEVVNVHRMYHLFIKAAPTAEEFRAFFAQKNAVAAVAVLNQSGLSDAAKLVQIYNRYRDRMANYLFHVANTRVGARKTTWLGDPTAYAYVRGLVQAGRVIARQGDLNGATTLKSIGDTTRALKVPVRAIYTSNAEGFFKYTPAFRDNFRSLPHDEKSVIIRTYKRGMPVTIGCTWHYNLHQLDDFLSRADAPGYPDVNRIMDDLRAPAVKAKLETLGTSYYDGTVPRH